MADIDITNSIIPDDVGKVDYEDPIKNCVYVITDDSDDESDICIVEDQSSDVVRSNVLTVKDNVSKNVFANDEFSKKRSTSKNKLDIGISNLDTDFQIVEVQNVKEKRAKDLNRLKKNRKTDNKDNFNISKKVFVNDKFSEKRSSSKNKFDKGISNSDADFQIVEVQSMKELGIKEYNNVENSKENQVKRYLEKLRNNYVSDTDTLSVSNKECEKNKEEICNLEDWSFGKSCPETLNGNNYGTNKKITADDGISKKRSIKKKRCKVDNDFSDPDFRIEKIKSRKKRISEDHSKLNNGKQTQLEKFLESLKEGYIGDANDFSSSNVDRELVESCSSENVDKDSGNESLSELQVEEILLLAWHLEIEKQEAIFCDLEKKRGLKRKRRRCDCKIVYQTLKEDDNPLNTKKRVNYLTRFTCCKFRKVILGNSYYVPKEAEPIRSSSFCKKTELVESEDGFNEAINSDDKVLSRNSKDDNDISLSEIDSFDKLLALEFDDQSKPHPNHDNGYCSGSSVNKL